jgi:hypothetical protein
LSSGVIDLVRIVMVAGALLASVRARHQVGIALALAALAMIGAEVALLFSLPAGPMPAELAFGAIFLGPTSLAPIDPLHHLVTSLHPETEEARSFDRAGLRFVGVAVLHALLSLSGIMGRALGR